MLGILGIWCGIGFVRGWTSVGSGQPAVSEPGAEGTAPAPNSVRRSGMMTYGFGLLGVIVVGGLLVFATGVLIGSA